MKLYDFSIYAKRRDEKILAEKISVLIPRLSEPGAVLELKTQVNSWFILHQEILSEDQAVQYNLKCL